MYAATPIVMLIDIILLYTTYPIFYTNTSIREFFDIYDYVCCITKDIQTTVPIHIQLYIV